MPRIGRRWKASVVVGLIAALACTMNAAQVSARPAAGHAGGPTSYLGCNTSVWPPVFKTDKQPNYYVSIKYRYQCAGPATATYRSVCLWEDIPLASDKRLACHRTTATKALDANKQYVYLNTFQCSVGAPWRNVYAAFYFKEQSYPGDTSLAVFSGNSSVAC